MTITTTTTTTTAIAVAGGRTRVHPCGEPLEQVGHVAITARFTTGVVGVGVGVVVDDVATVANAIAGSSSSGGIEIRTRIARRS